MREQIQPYSPAIALLFSPVAWAAPHFPIDDDAPLSPVADDAPLSPVADDAPPERLCTQFIWPDSTKAWAVSNVPTWRMMPHFALHLPSRSITSSGFEPKTINTPSI